MMRLNLDMEEGERVAFIIWPIIEKAEALCEFQNDACQGKEHWERNIDTTIPLLRVTFETSGGPGGGELWLLSF